MRVGGLSGCSKLGVTCEGGWLEWLCFNGRHLWQLPAGVSAQVSFEFRLFLRRAKCDIKFALQTGTEHST